METYLPIIKAIFSDWLQLTLAYPLYAAALAVSVWLLTAIIYSIRIASLNKKNIASEKARLEIQNNLNTAQQQMQLMREELTSITGEMEKAKQLAQNEAGRAAGLEEQLSQRNNRIAGIIQSLHTSFDLGERPLPVTEDVNAEGLWQQHDRVISLLTTRLRSEQQANIELQQTYQAETVRRAEKEALIDKLQTTIAAQSSQVLNLEQALELQKSMMQQQQDKAQQVLSQTLEKHLSESARLTELEQQALGLVDTRQQLTQMEEKLNAKNALITQLEKDKPVDQVKAQPQPAFIKQEEIETIVELKKTAEVVPPLPPVIEQPPVSPAKEQPRGVSGKLKSLFGKTKQETIAPETETVETKPDETEIQPEPLSPGKPSVSPAKGQFGKFKNLFGSKQQPEKAKQKEPSIQTAPVAVEQPPVSSGKDRFGKTKYYFGDIKQQSEETKQVEAETQPAAFEDEQPSVSAAKGQLGKLKNLFGSKQQPSDIKQNEKAIQPVPVLAEQPSVTPAKGQLEKLKNLLGSKQKSKDTKQDEAGIQPTPSGEEKPSVGAAKGQLGKLKNLFGKTK